ncbi:uncharacterized protein [Diadema setosum]|uniref:uncharacterized protein n=1 Tax=Diadema setosum TaxID=31175 RepID=UPI003B3AB97B
MTDLKKGSAAESIDSLNDGSLQIVRPPNAKAADFSDEYLDHASSPQAAPEKNVDEDVKIGKITSEQNGRNDGNAMSGKAMSRASPADSNGGRMSEKSNGDLPENAVGDVDDESSAAGKTGASQDDQVPGYQREEEGTKTRIKTKSPSEKNGSRVHGEEKEGMAKEELAKQYENMELSELVVGVETALEAMSKGRSWAFVDLMAVMDVLLPHVLYLEDELTAAQKKKKELLLQIRNLQKEVHRLSLAGRDRKKLEMVSTGTTVLITNDVKQTKMKDDDPPATPSPTLNQGAEIADDMAALKGKLKKQRYQIQELHQVNMSWEKYCSQQSTRHEIELKKKDAQLAAADEKRQALERKVDDKFKEYDRILLHAGAEKDQAKTDAARYRRERDGILQKYEEIKTRLKDLAVEAKEKDAEIKRLNEVLGTSGRSKSSSKAKKPDGATQQKADIRDTTRAATRVKKSSDSEEDVLIVVREFPIEPRGPRDKKKQMPSASRYLYENEYDEVPEVRNTPPRSPVNPNPNGGTKSLTKTELKEQVQLCKEQMEIFRNDFNQERRDREMAVGQVGALREELKKAKIKLKDVQKQRDEKANQLQTATRRRYRNDRLDFNDLIDEEEMHLRDEKQDPKRRTGHGRALDDYQDIDWLAERLYEEAY